jgi:hypothetical protein
MFEGCTNFNQPLKWNRHQPLKWNTQRVYEMKNMFKDCSNFNQDLSTWTTHKGCNFENMFDNCPGMRNNISYYPITYKNRIESEDVDHTIHTAFNNLKGGSRKRKRSKKEKPIKINFNKKSTKKSFYRKIK